MKINKKVFFIIIICTFIVGLIGYEAGKGSAPSTINPKPRESQSTATASKQGMDPLVCPFTMKAGIFKDYIGTANEVSVGGKPEIINNPQVIKINYSFKVKELDIKKMIVNEDGSVDDGSLGISKPEKFDVDGDGKAEDIYTADVYMNHRPHVVMVVKNGIEIFEANGGGLWIEKAYLGQGFTIGEEIDRWTGESKKTRYVPKDGGFMPVWTQRICYVQFR